MWAHSRLVSGPGSTGTFGPNNDYTMDSAVAGGLLMEMLALGGRGVNATVGVFTPGADGAHTITGDLDGDTPDLVVLITNGLSGGDSGTTTGVEMAWGAASAADQWACWNHHPYNSSAGQASQVVSGRILCRDTGSDVTLTGMIPDGFTLTLTNWVTAGAPGNIWWIAIKLPAGVKVGYTQQPASTGTVSETGFGFDPSALIVSSSNPYAGISTGAAQNGPGFVGGFAAVEGDGQFCQSAGHYPGDRYQTASWFDDAHVVKVRESNGAGYADVAEATAVFATDGIDFDWTICDGNDRFFPYIAVETDESYDGTPPIVNFHFGARWSGTRTVAGQGVDGTFTSSPGDANIAPSIGFARGPSPDAATVGWYGGGQDSVTTASAREAAGLFAGSSFPAAVWSLTVRRAAQMSRFLPQIIRLN